MQKTTEYHFVYPWVKGEDQFCELKYSLRSLDQYFLEPFKVFIVGDLPGWIQNVEHIPHKRAGGMHENVLYDAIDKMYTVCRHPAVNTYFIRMYDDTYLLKPLGFEAFIPARALYNATTHTSKGDGTASTTWSLQKERTLAALKEKNHPQWNTETHLPEVFLKNILIWVLDSFEAQKNRLLISTLYNNTILCHCDQPDIVNIHSKEKAGFYGTNSEYSFYSNNLDEIKTICAKRMFLNHNDAGLSQALRKFIMDKFSAQSKFEK